MRDSNGIVVGYITANEDPILALSVQQMLSYSWVAGVVILDTSKNGPTVESPRLVRHHQHFGSGFDRSVENAGFDEVSARNRLLKLMRLHAKEDANAEWLLICDSDEYYTPKTGTLPTRLSRNRKEVAWLNCWHLATANSYVYQERYSLLIQGSRMYDPHPRLFHRAAVCDYVINQDLPVVYPDAKNNTQHCWLRFKDAKIEPVPGIFHIHMRYLLGKSEVPEDAEVRKISPPLRLPEHYTQFMASIEDTAVV